MKNEIQKTLYILLFIILSSCNTTTEVKNEPLQSDFLKSKGFNQAKNQFGELVDFIFRIDTLNKIEYDKKDFYKLNLTAFDSIYIGKNNDTIFSFDQGIKFKEIFVVLDDKKSSYLGRLGIDYQVSLIDFNDSIFRYSFKKIKNNSEGDYIIMGYEYPELTISKMDISRNGKIVDLTIEQNINGKKDTIYLEPIKKPTFEPIQPFEVSDIKKTDDFPSSMEDVEICEHWKLTENEIQIIITESRPINGHEWHYLFGHYTCNIDAKLIQNGNEFEASINGGAWLFVRTKDTTQIFGSFEEKNNKYFLDSAWTEEWD